MSNATTRRFVILSQGVNTSDDVFNNLVLVRDKETGEEGTLLCSHMCNWPQELISQATWLEGCKTPEEYKDEPRLSLGYHPDQYTQWRVYRDLNEIEIYLTGGWGDEEHNPDEEDQEVWLHTGLTSPNSYFSRGANASRDQFSPILFRLADRITGRYAYSENKQERLDALEATIHRLLNTGRISAWEATVFPSYYFSLILPSWARIHWEGPLNLFLGEGLAAFQDVGIYCFNSNPELGFMKAVDLHSEYIYDSESNVYRDVVDYCNPNQFLTDEEIELGINLV